MGDIQERDSAWWTMGFRVVPQNVQTYHDICGGFLSHGVPPNPKSSQIIQVIRLIWDRHLWLIGGLEHFLLVHILVMSKKNQLTKSYIFQRGRSSTNQPLMTVLVLKPMTWGSPWVPQKPPGSCPVKTKRWEPTRRWMAKPSWVTGRQPPWDNSPGGVPETWGSVKTYYYQF